MKHALKVREELLDALDPRFRSPLFSMYRGEPQFGTDGRRHPIDTGVSIFPSQGMWLYERANRTDFVEVHSDQENIGVFRKIGDDARKWSHFRKFAVPDNSD